MSDAHEDELCAWMLAYDEALASGGEQSTRAGTAETPAGDPRRSAAACIDLIERLRQHDSHGSRDDLSETEGIKSLPESYPDKIGRFEVKRELGKGGFGIVFLARDPTLNRHVALKVPRPEVLLTPELRERFLREAQAAGTLGHANIVAVFESGTIGAVAYIASAYCHGPTLAQWLNQQQRPVPAESAARLVATLCGALQHAHDRGVLHRDLKPGNVILDTVSPGENVAESSTAHATDSGSGSDLPGDATETSASLSQYVAKIADFGLAKIDSGSGGQTRSHAIIGTPSYMSPEQAASRIGDIGPPTDIYGLGTILYQLLTDRPPFLKHTDLATLQSVQTEEPVAPRRLRRDIPSDLSAICLKCLEKNSLRRYTSATALADDLHRFLGGVPVQARPISAGRRVVRWAARNHAVATLAAISALLLITVATLATTGYFRVAAALRETDRQRMIAANALQSQTQQRRRAERLAVEASRQRELAESNFDAARNAVEDYLSTVSESVLLEEPALLPLRKQLLQHARDYHQQLAAQYSDDPDLRTDLAISYLRLGMISHDLGEPDWLTPVEKSLELFEALIDEGVSLAQSDPIRAGMYNVRSSWFDNSDPEKSFEVFRRGIEVWEKLYQQHSDVPGIQSDLAALHSILGLLHFFEQDSEPAIRHLERARVLREQLVKAFPEQPSYPYFLAETLTVSGIQYLQARRPTDARRVLQRAVALFRDSLDRQGQAARIEFNLCLAEQHLGQALLQNQRPLQGLMQFTTGMKRLENLAQRYPYSNDYQVSLAASYASLADALRRADMDTAARDAEAKTDKQVKVILSQPLDVVGNGSAILGMAYLNLGGLLRSRGQLAEAEAVIQRCLAVRADRPADTVVRNAKFHLAMIDRAQGELEACQEHLAEAIELHRARNRSNDRYLANWLLIYGDGWQRLDHPDQARAAYLEAKSILQAATEGDQGQLQRVNDRLAKLGNEPG